MGAAIVVEDLKRPVLLHVLDGDLFDFSMMTMLDLFDVEDSRNNMSPQINIGIFGALFTFRIQYESSQRCHSGAKYVNALIQRYYAMIHSL